MTMFLHKLLMHEQLSFGNKENSVFEEAGTYLAPSFVFHFLSLCLIPLHMSASQQSALAG